MKRLSLLTQYERGEKDREPHELSKSGDPIEKAPFGAVITNVGLVLTKELNIEQWNELGQVLARNETAVHWAIGDWWAHGFQQYGKKKAAASARKLPYEFGSLMNLGSVARKVQPSSRNEALSFSHHTAVAKLDRDDQVKWLGRAEKGKWSVNKLRQMLYEHRSEPFDANQQEAKHAWDWAFRLEQEAEKPTDPRFYISCCDDWLELISPAAVRSLAAAAAKSAKAWSEIAESLRERAEKRKSDPTEPQRSKRLQHKSTATGASHVGR